jgi:uncharacterized protein YjbJ (UPF0337 family)
LKIALSGKQGETSFTSQQFSKETILWLEAWMPFFHLMSNNDQHATAPNQSSNDQQPATFVPMNLHGVAPPQQPAAMQPPSQSSNIPLGQPPIAQAQLDPSNPYNFPVNSVSAAGYNDPTSASHTTLSGSDIDPQLAKITSSWSYATGFMQERFGSIIGNEEMVSSGKATQEKANQEWSDADNRHKSGVPSRIGGEYESIMGTIMQKVGYVAGDPEMEARAALRARQGRDEVAKVTNSHH